MEAQLAALASAAASTVVRLLATDAWEQAKDAIGSLWRHSHPDRAPTVETELAETRSALLAARSSGDDQVERDLTVEWQGRLGRLLSDDPGLVVLAQRLVDELSALSPRDTRSAASHTELHGRATGRGRVFQAGRDLHITDS